MKRESKDKVGDPTTAAEAAVTTDDASNRRKIAFVLNPPYLYFKRYGGFSRVLVTVLVGVRTWLSRNYHREFIRGQPAPKRELHSLRLVRVHNGHRRHIA